MTATTTATSKTNLISSSRVEGTDVYGVDGAHIGHIDHLMIDKPSGNVAYAVMGFGGFLGLGEDHHPIPWQKLQYDTQKDGFVTDITEADVKGAPERPDTWWSDRNWEERTHQYYGVPHYWI
ncbi:PRC-barrel domain-containing protein [Pseudooceanicola sp.]|uniref:PRC-barrel domain-containing protein n=1 Tax=Pseudooceanicola sp. TaxID=1914328 RepID=UPI0035C78523